MVESAIEAEKLDVQHVRQPGQREPVAGERMPERPSHAFRRDPGAHMDVRRDVIRVVVVDETEVQRLPVDRKNGRHQQDGDADIGGAAGCRRGGARFSQSWSVSGAAHPKGR